MLSELELHKVESVVFNGFSSYTRKKIIIVTRSLHRGGQIFMDKFYQSEGGHIKLLQTFISPNVQQVVEHISQRWKP